MRTQTRRKEFRSILGLEYRDPSVIDMRSTNLGGTVPSAGTFCPDVVGRRTPRHV